MSKAYTEEDFSRQISEDRAWRIKEISDLKSAILKADATLQRVLLRALVTVCYAHWEGNVRFSARRYLEYIAIRKLRFAELDRQFWRNHFLPRLGAISSSKLSIVDRSSLVDEILDLSEKRFSRINDDLVNTKANLNFDVLSDICLVCGVPGDASIYNPTFIDVVLLKRRNSIAHGEDTFVAVSDLDELADGTIGLMRTFGDSLDNRVYTKSYKAA